MVRALGAILAVFAGSIPASASADGWDCWDKIELDGKSSSFLQSYHGSRNPAVPIIGPYHQLSAPNFFVGWPNKYESLDDAFRVPDKIGFGVPTSKRHKSGLVTFRAEGEQPVTLRIPRQLAGADTPPRVYFSLDQPGPIAAILSRPDWNVTISNRRGRVVEVVNYNVPFTLDEMRDLFDRHVVNMRVIEKDIASKCHEDLSELVI